MDRIDFFNNLECKDKISENFDEIMSLYDVVSPYNSELSINENTPLSIDLTLPSIKTATELKGSLDRIELVKYRNNYVVETTLNNNIINLKLNRVSG